MEQAWLMCQYAKETMEQIFKIFILTFLANFYHFKCVLSLWNSSSRAIWADRLPLVYLFISTGICFYFIFLCTLVWFFVRNNYNISLVPSVPQFVADVPAAAEDGKRRCGLTRTKLQGANDVSSVWCGHRPTPVVTTILSYTASAAKPGTLCNGNVHLFVCLFVCHMKRVLVGHWPAWPSSTSNCSDATRTTGVPHVSSLMKNFTPRKIHKRATVVSYSQFSYPSTKSLFHHIKWPLLCWCIGRAKNRNVVKTL